MYNTEECNKLESQFKEAREQYPEHNTREVLTYVLMAGRYPARTIRWGVIHLVNKNDIEPYSKIGLRIYLYALASPPILKSVWLTIEQAEQLRNKLKSPQTL